MSRWTDLARWTPTEHHGGQMAEHRGLVLHIAEGYYDGTIAWQKGDHDVSSHFVVGREPGECAQLVDTDMTAWTQRTGNGHWISAEFAGFTAGHRLHRPGWERLSEWQLGVAARLLVKAHHQYGVPVQIATSAAGRGLGHHSMGGTAWGHLDCPGRPIIEQKTQIITLARELLGGGEDDMDKATFFAWLTEWSRTKDGRAALNAWDDTFGETNAGARLANIETMSQQTLDVLRAAGAVVKDNLQGPGN